MGEAGRLTTAPVNLLHALMICVCIYCEIRHGPTYDTCENAGCYGPFLDLVNIAPPCMHGTWNIYMIDDADAVHM